jgi:hypothetical protein
MTLRGRDKSELARLGVVSHSNPEPSGQTSRNPVQKENYTPEACYVGDG